ncbi:MAG: RNA degradosome polyphosphate kinase, partial [Alphaproteobacteria bacterium]|nr:RNA degradosome polyphosphate kinase [Alphaproteobacteria bacterium]
MARQKTADTPAASKATAAAPSAPRERYFNRELSWLAFNWRVLAEAENTAHPLLERLRFLSISASNLDEFFMVRVAGLKGQVRNGLTHRSLDGRTPVQQLEEVMANTNRLMAAQLDSWRELLIELKAAGVAVVGSNDLTDADVDWLRDYFLKQVFPVLTPLAIDPAHPFPFIANRGFALAMQLVDDDDGRTLRALVPLPEQTRRFVRLPGDNIRYLPLESLVELFIDQLFPGYRVTGRGCFRLIRDSDIEYEEEAEDLVLLFETALRQRRRGGIVRLKIGADMPAELRQMVISELHAEVSDITVVDGILGMAQTAELVDCDRPNL